MKLFSFITLHLFIISIYFVLAIDFPINLPLFSSKLNQEEISQINNSFSVLFYSYIVSFLVYFFTIILPFSIRLLKFFPYLRVRFRSYCNDWADLYNILNVTLQLNSPIADQDTFVKIFVDRTHENYQRILSSNEKCVAFNLSEYIRRIEQFHNLLNSNRESIPSGLLSQLDILNSQLILVLKGRCIMLNQGSSFKEVSDSLKDYTKYISQQFRYLSKCQEFFTGKKLMREVAEKIPNKTLVQY